MFKCYKCYSTDIHFFRMYTAMYCNKCNAVAFLIPIENIKGIEEKIAKKASECYMVKCQACERQDHYSSTEMQENPYRECAFKCDNNAVDIVSITASPECKYALFHNCIIH